jgi:hypothetical protein
MYDDLRMEKPELSVNLLDTVNHFVFDVPGQIDQILGGWSTGPDAEVYKVVIAGQIYYLYLDDFSTPEEARRTIAHLEGSPKGEFVKVKKEILDKVPLSEYEKTIESYVERHPYGFEAARGTVFYFKPEAQHGKS